MYQDTFEKLLTNASYCNSPCDFFTVRAIKTDDKFQSLYMGKRIAYLVIDLKENIKVVTAYHLYSALSLIAEIGGYVGLFLGVSINQITSLMDIKFNFRNHC